MCNTNAYVELTIYLMNINVYPINCSERSMIRKEHFYWLKFFFINRQTTPFWCEMRLISIDDYNEYFYTYDPYHDMVIYLVSL